MKKIISLVLAILMVITMLPLNVINAEGDNEVSVVTWDKVNKKDVPTVGELTFVISRGFPLEEVTTFMSKNGKAILPDLADGQYNLSLKDNKYYQTLDIFTVVNDGIYDFDGEEKIYVNVKPGVTIPEPEPEDEEEFGEKAILVSTNDGKTLSGDYTFVISDGENEQSVKPDSNGSIEFKVYKNKEYTIKLMENSNYKMEEVTVRCEKATNDFGIQVYRLIKSDGSELNSLIVNAKETTEPQKETREFIFDVLCGSCGRIPVELPITFKVTNLSNSDSKEYVSNSGQVKMSLTEGEEYKIEVITNKEYDHDPVNLTVKNANGNLSVFTEDNALFTEFVMTKKDLTGECAEDVCDFSDKKITMAPIPIKVNNNGLLEGLPENDEVIFDLYNTSKSERVGEIRTVDGKIPALEVYEKDDYILFTSEKNDKYIMADVPFEKEVSELYFQANGENNLPIRHKTKNPYAKDAKLDVKYLQVRPIKEGDRLGSKYIIDYVRIKTDKNNPKDYSKLKFIFTSEYETIEATTLPEDEWGVPLTALNLIENVQYSVRVEDPDNKYAIENFPFTLVDKSERGPNHPQGWGDGKYVFNHAFCGNATFLTLVEKGTENNNNTVIKCSNGHTTVSGMNFHDLMLRTIRPDKNTITSMDGKDFDLFRFKLINPKRCEVTKMAEGNFEIHREIPEGKKVANVYQVNKDGSLTKLEFEQNGNIVDIKTTTLSIYDTLIEYEKEEPAKEPLTIIVKKGNDVFTESLTLEIFDGDNLVETVEPNQGMGAVTKYEVGKTYTVKLKDNDKYELVTGFMKVVGEDGMAGAHFLETIDEEISFENAAFVKIKDKEVDQPKEPKDPLEVMVMKDNMPVLEGLTLEIMDGDKIVETVNVANSQASITTYEVGKTYTLKLKDSDKYEILTKFMKVVEESGLVGAHFLESEDEETSRDNAVKLKLKDKESTEPSEPQVPTVETLDELTIKLKVDDEFKEGIQLRVNLWDALNIPSVISQPKTDANGEVVLKDLNANAKYSITVGSRGYTFKPDTIEVLTDEDGKIKTVNGKAATEYKDGLVIEGHSKATEPTTTVNVPIKTLDKETGKPVAGVEITANIINPLSSFKNFKSDENGNVNLELEGTQEGRVYALTISKNDQFNWDFEPELIEVIVLEDSYQILKSKGNENAENIFKVTKNDRNHLRNDLKELIEKAEALIASGKYTNESLAGLKEAVQGGKAELAKDETIPYYVEGHIDKINKAIEKLVLIEQPEQPDQPEEPEKPVEPTPQPTPEPEYNPGYRYEPSPDYMRDYTRRDEKPVERKEEVKEEKKEEKPVEDKKDEVLPTEVLSPIDVMAPSLPVDLPDVNGNPAIIDMVARGIFKGMGSGKFEPDTTISRAMVTEVFMRISRDKSINQNIEFTDVKADDWYNNSVKWAADKNIVTGFEDGSFKANQKVTIQEFAAMLDRLITKYNINLPVVNPVNRNDFEYINEWSRESVIKMVEFGLIKLDENGKIDPNREFKRVEIAEALYKLIKFIEEN